MEAMTMITGKRWVLAVLFAQMAIGPAWAGNKLINVQGKITDNAGNPLSGQVTVTFRMYANVSDPVGSALWTESQGLTATNGQFNAALGSVTTLDPLPFNVPYYLGMQVAGDNNELAPRQLLGASAYALGSPGDFSVAHNVVVGGNSSVQGSATTNGDMSI